MTTGLTTLFLVWKSLELFFYKVEPMTLGLLQIGLKAQESSCQEFYLYISGFIKSILLELRQNAF